MNKNLVFVYGTLKRGFSNHYLLEKSTFIGEGVTEENMIMYERGIPFLNDEEKGITQIHGEVYEVTDRTLDKLDLLEGYNKNFPDNSFYKRKIKSIILNNNVKLNCFVYICNYYKGNIIKSGKYEY